MISLATILKTYPSVGDVAICFSLVPLFPELFRYCNSLYVPTLMLIVSSCMLPLFHHLWLYSGSGNSNFYYALTLVASVGQLGWVVDLTRAMICREGARVKGSGVWRRMRLETAGV